VDELTPSAAVPEVSVVIGVYNGARDLHSTLHSVLSQVGVDFEVVVVDDGSTDDTPSILQEVARQDERLRVITQPNAGLTNALVRGCAAARGRFIGRQDVGDRSLPGRLFEQLSALKVTGAAVLCVTGVREFLADVACLAEIIPQRDREQFAHDLRERMTGVPAHGCVMFCRQAYTRVGGYRPAFYYAQDMDLWLRLAFAGDSLAVPQVLYEMDASVGGISSSRSKLQGRFAGLAKLAHEHRQRGVSDSVVLAQAQRLTEEAKRQAASPPSRYVLAGALYRLAVRAAAVDATISERYLDRSLRTCPLYWRSWALRLQRRIGV